MKSASKKNVEFKVSTGPVNGFIQRSLERARKLDRGEKLLPETTMTFEDPADLMRALSVERVRVIHAVRVRPTPLSDLAKILNRDRAAVNRDVNVLESLGLVRIHEESNPGHGRRKVVEPLAAKYQLVVTI
jgi:predicted transcriptional regulator